MNSETKSMNKKNTLSKNPETLIKNQIEILEVKNSTKAIKNELVSTGNTADQMEERISDTEDRNLEMTQGRR